ncbi:MAG: dihydrodipicolinate synthase family protein [Gemmatimonadaceae bacterium]|nr:dihydrodipicolinate synthase family protein [Gemmatimonadaceae bacterium]
MPTRPLGGILAAATTPFGADGALDAAAAATNAAALIDAGLQGLVLCGSTGEAPLLDDGERDALLAAVRPHVPTDRWLLMGIGAESTRQTIARAQRAGAGGADAVLVVAPHYYTNAMTPAAQEAHYRAVADASPVPVLLYSIPQYMHFALDAEVVGRLASHPNVIGIKDSGADAVVRDSYQTLAPAPFAVFTGHAPSLRIALATGCEGAILATGCIAPALCLAIAEAVHGGDEARGRALQQALTRLATEVAVTFGVPGLKAAVDAAGRVGGAPRAPLLPLSDAAREQVVQVTRDVLASA